MLAVGLLATANRASRAYAKVARNETVRIAVFPGALRNGRAYFVFAAESER